MYYKRGEGWKRRKREAGNSGQKDKKSKEKRDQ